MPPLDCDSGRWWSWQIRDDAAAHPEDVHRGVRPHHRRQLQQALGD